MFHSFADGGTVNFLKGGFRDATRCDEAELVNAARPRRTYLRARRGVLSGSINARKSYVLYRECAGEVEFGHERKADRRRTPDTTRMTSHQKSVRRRIRDSPEAGGARETQPDFQGLSPIKSVNRALLVKLRRLPAPQIAYRPPSLPPARASPDLVPALCRPDLLEACPLGARWRLRGALPCHSLRIFPDPESPAAASPEFYNVFSDNPGLPTLCPHPIRMLNA